jgi:GntR family transcriptional regulator, carbon starvation induced regulator
VNGHLNHRTLTAELESRLRGEILAGNLRPGERLRVGEVARRYHVSATPVREALQRLAEQGLVTIDPQVGARISPISIDDVRDLYYMRSVLEPEALRRSIERGDADWVNRVTREWDQFKRLSERIFQLRDLSPDEEVEATIQLIAGHRALHLTLAGACGSSWALRFLETLYAHSSRYQPTVMRDPDLAKGWIAEHQDIVDAALRRNGELAAAMTRHQLALASEAVERSLGPLLVEEPKPVVSNRTERTNSASS